MVCFLIIIVIIRTSNICSNAAFGGIFTGVAQVAESVAGTVYTAAKNVTLTVGGAADGAATQLLSTVQTATNNLG